MDWDGIADISGFWRLRAPDYWVQFSLTDAIGNVRFAPIADEKEASDGSPASWMTSPRLHTYQALATAMRSLSPDLWVLLARPFLICQNALLILLNPNHFFRAAFVAADFISIRHCEVLLGCV
jgi:hypothetical protein